MLKVYILLLLTSLIFSIIAGFPLIKLLRNIGVNQYIREEGPKDHLATKRDTPTIGGIIFLIPTFIISSTILYIYKSLITLDLIVVLLATLIIAISGFLDDFLKLKRKHNKGISGWFKLFVQLIISIIIFMLYKGDQNILYLVWVFLIFAGSCNSFNLTDGLDGLAASVSIASLCGLAYLLNSQFNYDLTIFSVILIGSLVGFLYFNRYPATIFMGDTGSLAIGAAIGSLALVSGNGLYLLIFAIVPVLEAISVILQVASCKLSKKFLNKDIRIFKMTPLHHHFELLGWKETTIVKCFFFVQAICTLIGILVINSH